MKWIELKEAAIGSGTIFLFGCHPTQSPYKVKAWLQEKKPNAVVLYAGKVASIRPYQAAHWVKHYDANLFHNYLTEGYRQNMLHTAMLSLHSALGRFAKEHGFKPEEVVIVRASKYR